MTYKTLLLEISDSGIATLKINRPEALNALNKAVIEELQQALESLSHNRNLRCLVISGEGKAFVAGADIKEMQDYTASEALEMADRGQRVLQMIEDFPVATIAAVNGFALGGGLELALACDFILASESAKVGLPEVSLGLIPGYGGTQRLPRNIGRSLAKMMILTGDIFSAEQALAWGLVARVFPKENFLEEVMKVAQKAASRSPLALSFAKKAVHEGFALPLAQGLSKEALYFSETFKTQDHNEGIKAFVEKRAPQFKGE